MQRSTTSNQKSARKDAAAWAQRGTIATASGNTQEARKCFVAAIKRDSRNARYRYNLGLILQSGRDYAGAAEQLTTALALDPVLIPAAERLQDVLSRGRLPEQTKLNEVGMTVAMAIDSIDRDLICATSLDYLSRTHPLRNVLEHGRRVTWHAIAQKILVEKTHEIIGHELFVAAIRHGIVVNKDIEALLRALRCVALMELPDKKLTDITVCKFIAALMHQCRNNEYIWNVTDVENRRLAEIADTAAQSPLRGDAPTATEALQGLYGRLAPTLPPRAAVRLDTLEPGHRILLETLYEQQDEDRGIQARGASLPSLSGLADAVSRSVAEQYEASPYPRWTSVPLFPAPEYISHLKRYFKSGQLAFADRPFEVLIAGCGTGRQAISAALDYGPNARVTGVDISRTSLGYAAMMAERFQVRNLSLSHGDLNRIEDFKPGFKSRFSIIECSGVLHHMADPFGAWEKLLSCLTPDGIMLVGLYSRLARRNLEVLRREPAYPGTNASQDALRAYRSELLSRSGDWPGAELVRSRDTHSASGFRDLFLHVNEHVTDLLEIDQFLTRNGMQFRGFVDVPFQVLLATHPASIAPGALSEWDEWERAHPNAFSGMYQFWCTRA